MKKKMSLIGLNNNEIKKNEMKPLLAEEMKGAKGGGKCPFPNCLCFCHSGSDYSDDYDQFFEEYLANLSVW